MSVKSKLKVLSINSLEFLLNTKYEYLNIKKEINYTTEFKKIALILTSPLGFGDLIMMLPVINSFIKNFPKSKIDLITNLDIFDEIEGINKIIIVKGDLISMKQEFLTLSSNKYDLGVVMARAINQSIYLNKLNPRFKIGYISGKKINSDFKLKNKNNLFFEKNLHFTLNSLKILEAMNLKINYDFPKILYTKKIQKDAKQIFNKLDLDKNKKTIFINPYVLWETRRLDENKYIELIIKLHSKFNFVLYGGPDGLELSKRIEIELLQNKIKIVNLVGKVKLKTSICLLNYADLFITSDSGPMHFAIMMKVPTLAIFGPINPKYRLPLNFEKTKIFDYIWYRDYVSFEKEYDYESEYENKNMNGLKAIPVKDIENKILKFFKER